MSTIKSINYKNSAKDPNFEMVDLSLFFATRSSKMLKSDYRLNFWVLIYIIEGSGSHIVDFHRYTYEAGDMILVQKNQVQRFEINDSVKGYILHFNEPFMYENQGEFATVFLDFFDRSLLGAVASIDNSSGTTNRTLIDLIYKEYMMPQELYNEKLIYSLIQSFIYSMQESIEKEIPFEQSSLYKTYNLYRKLVDEQFIQFKTVDEYAQVMGVSKKTINKASREITGRSAKEVIIDRMILEIKRYLSQGKMMVYEISDHLAFDEPSNMTKFFKRYVGESPKEFQKNHIQL